MVGMSLYSILPQLIPFLAGMNIPAMIWPQSKIVNTLFGLRKGLALLPLTLSYQTLVIFLGICQI